MSTSTGCAVRLAFLGLLASQAWAQIVVTISATETVICTPSFPIPPVTLTATITNPPPGNPVLNWSFVGTPWGTLSATTGASVIYTTPVFFTSHSVTIQVTSASDPYKFTLAQITLQIGCGGIPISNPAFVTRLYNGFLGRSPDTNGLNYWIYQLNQGMSEPQVGLAFFNSPEATTFMSNRLLVTKAYFGFLNRPPDPGGLTYWADQLNAGVDPLFMVRAFIESLEFVRSFTF